MKTVYIIEDDELLRELLTTFLAGTFPDLELLGASGDGLEAMEACQKLAPDLVIVDIQLPEINGLEILHLLKGRFPEIKVLIFTGIISPQSLQIAAHGKADGFVNKSAGMDELAKAVESLRKGGHYFSPDIYDRVLRMRNEA